MVLGEELEWRCNWRRDEAHAISLPGTPNGNATHTPHGNSCCEAVTGTAPNLVHTWSRAHSSSLTNNLLKPPGVFPTSSHLLVLFAKITESRQAVIPLGERGLLILDPSPAKTLEINERETASADCSTGFTV